MVHLLIKVFLQVGKLPTLEDSVCVRFREHIVLTLEPSPDNTVSPSHSSLLAVFHMNKKTFHIHIYFLVG